MALDTAQKFDDSAIRVAAEVETAIAAGDWTKAHAAANRAISRGLRHPVFFMMRAQRMEEGGHLQFALEDYQRAAAVAPGDPKIHEAVGLCAMKLEEHAIAVSAFDAALACDPNLPLILYRRGVCLTHLSDHEGAERSYELALAIDPVAANVLADLSSIVVRKGEQEKARDLAHRALAIDPNQPMAMVSLALADQAQRRYADAERVLMNLLSTDLPQSFNRSQVHTLLGDALDGQKKYPEAFAAYCRANEGLLRQFSAKYSGNLGSEAARHLINFFEGEPAGRWRPAEDAVEVEGEFDGHVFLLGFMRSGTTLLEQVLASNPDIAALEEKGLLSEPGERYFTSFPGLQKLADIHGEELANVRRDYWKRARELLPTTSARIFLDKQPLNTSRLPLIAKAFPKARIIFALRDPRDVVFSCFRRHLRVTGTQYEFLLIENCARFYSNLMRLAEICRNKMPMNLLEHRYEDMVQDFDGRIQAVCDFIGVPFTDAMRNFSEQKIVADLRSPSAMQVRQPLYGDGIAHWRRYADQLAPILPILEPWVEKFGYPKD
jgi:tetratricopeptide (TPR) repeat protein